MREKDARDAEICPCTAAGVLAGEEANESRSRRRDADCFSAELNREFYRYQYREAMVWLDIRRTMAAVQSR